MLVIISLVSDFGYIWIQRNADKHPTLNTTNISTLENATVKTYVFDLSYYANTNHNSAELFEIKINCYTGINKDKIFSYGVQIVNPSAMTLKIELDKKDGHFWQWYDDEYYKYNIDLSKCQITYFNSDDTISYDATTELNTNKNPYVIDIDDELCAFTFEKISFFETELGFAGYKYNKYYTSSFEYFVYKMYTSMSTLSTEGKSQGLYENLNVNLNDVFAIYLYNNATKKFDALTDYGYSAEYMGVKIKYIDRGATMHEDSMFNKIGAGTKGGVIYG